MALSFRLIHRSLNSFSIIRRSFAASPANPALSSSFSSSPLRVPSLSKQSLASLQWPLLLQSRQFRSSPVSLSSSSSSSSSEVRFEPNHNWSYEEFKPRELGIDAIEGCDFNHWLIVMDFPKDPRPSPEEMVRSYEETCAKALDISVEEAKKKIYACSTSNYTGFHVEVTEIESEKFNGQPGVVFVLPDSYVDPEKKEYGGDKYINGVIIPRPRPTLNGKRNRDLPKHEQRARPIPNQQVNPSNGQEGPTPGGLKSNQLRNPSTTHQGPTPQSYPVKQSNGLPEGERRAPTNYPCQQNYGQPRLGEVYMHPENYVSPTPQNYSFGQNYNPLGQGERREHISMVAPAERNHYQPGNGGLIPSYSENYNQQGPGNFYPQDQRGFPLGDQRYYAPPSQQGDFRDDYRYYGPPQYRPYGYGVGGYQGQRPPEAYWQGPNSGCVRPGTMFSYMEGYPGHNQGQQFSQQAERNVQGANFYPQEQREFVQGYPSNHAPPRYQVHYRENNQNYVPAQETFYGGMGRYRGLGAPEAYWQGPNPRSVVQGTTCGYEQGYPEQIRSHSFSQEQPRNVQGVHYYSQEYREFPHGGQANYTPPRQQGYFRDDHQYYGPPQGTPYGHGVGEYQGHEASVAYWHGRKY